MHELSITQELVNTIDNARMGAGAGLRVTSVKLKIGRLTAVVPDILKFYYEMLTKDTPLEGAVIDIEIVPVFAKCAACDIEYQAEAPLMICPECGGPSELIAGRELLVDSIEVDDI